MARPTFPLATVDISGPLGNIFALGGAIGKLLRQTGMSAADVDGFYDRLHAAPSYSAALDICSEYVVIEGREDEVA